jgi:aquaporin Z
LLLSSVKSSSSEASGLRASCAEALGTFVLVFAGTGAIVVDSTSHGAVTHVGISLVFGLVVLALISALGDVSGAHMNPAVSIAFALSGRFRWRSVPSYVGGQLAGAFAASFLLALLFPGHPTLGATIPAGSAMQSFVLEIVLTWILMLVILSVSDGSHERGATAAIAIGSVVGLEALFAGPISGASMNPARSLAPALVSGSTHGVWIYVVAPVVGALIAVPCCRLLRSPGCCSAKAATT